MTRQPVESGGASGPELPLLGAVIIPAHNEAAVIRRCLDALLSGFLPGELDVTVVCNGCTDGTPDVVRSSGHHVRLLELAEASKPAALRFAEASVPVFPRLYLDADVILPAVSARRILECLRSGSALAARVPITYDTSGSARLVRSYYRARARMPAVMGSLWGAGAYGLSEAGRARFGEYPDGVGDDLFADKHFQRGEIRIVESAPVTVRAPRGVPDLLRIMRRNYQGKWQHRRVAGQDVKPPAGAPSALHDLFRLAVTRPARAADAVTYGALAAVARLTLVFSRPAGWERDGSSRTE